LILEMLKQVQRDMVLRVRISNTCGFQIANSFMSPTDGFFQQPDKPFQPEGVGVEAGEALSLLLHGLRSQKEEPLPEGISSFLVSWE
jgi:hypothetical protein